MNELEKAEIRSRMKGMDDEEKRLALMYFPTQMMQEEISRRYKVVIDVVDELHKTIGMITDESTLIEMQDIVNQCREILKMMR